LSFFIVISKMLTSDHLHIESGDIPYVTQIAAAAHLHLGRKEGNMFLAPSSD
jgi:hypothetical protein